MEQLPASMLQHLSNACERAFADPFSGNPGSGGFLAAARFVDAFRRRRMLHELVHGTARPRNELTPAVWAHAAQDFAHARAAERALEGTNEGLGGVGREIAVAALAVRAELQHFLPPALSRWAAPLCQSACARIERQLRTSTLGLPGKRRRNRAATDRSALKVERLGIRIRVDGNFRGATASRGLEGMRKKRPADAQVHESRQDPEMVELPRTTQRGKRVETRDFNSDHRNEGGLGADALWRYGQLGAPAFQSFGRIAPVRLGSHGQRRKELSLSFRSPPNVHRVSYLPRCSETSHFISGKCTSSQFLVP